MMFIPGVNTYLQGAVWLLTQFVTFMGFYLKLIVLKQFLLHLYYQNCIFVHLEMLF